MVSVGRYLVVLAGLMILSTAGCRESGKPDRSRQGSDTPNKQRQVAQPLQDPDVAPIAQPEGPPPPLVIPQVVMSDELRATCLINVGDAMPEAELTDLDGNARKLSGLYGPKLTVVCFWTIGSSARSQLVAEAVLKDLMKGVVGPFGERGVRVVAIDVDDGLDEVKKYVSAAEATFPLLLDPRGEFYAKIAKERKMPRTLLLDAQGKVLWFDVEYSNTARRDLTQGIEAALNE
ncbi:MAG: TlpA family protein disulfide reductase [Pirellulales bacterium]|nr:TlpA family protein disulfide reductase [Pirellulales bacterium]